MQSSQKRSRVRCREAVRVAALSRALARRGSAPAVVARPPGPRARGGASRVRASRRTASGGRSQRVPRTVWRSNRESDRSRRSRAGRQKGGPVGGAPYERRQERRYAWCGAYGAEIAASPPSRASRAVCPLLCRAFAAWKSMSIPRSRRAPEPVLERPREPPGPTGRPRGGGTAQVSSDTVGLCWGRKRPALAHGRSPAPEDGEEVAAPHKWVRGTHLGGSRGRGGSVGAP